MVLTAAGVMVVDAIAVEEVEVRVVVVELAAGVVDSEAVTVARSIASVHAPHDAMHSEAIVLVASCPGGAVLQISLTRLSHAPDFARK